ADRCPFPPSQRQQQKAAKAEAERGEVGGRKTAGNARAGDGPPPAPDRRGADAPEVAARPGVSASRQDLRGAGGSWTKTGRRGAGDPITSSERPRAPLPMRRPTRRSAMAG